MDFFLSDIQKKKKGKIGEYTIVKKIKVEIPAGGAAITPPLGPVLGQYGMNTIEFCKEFNEDTKIIEKDTIVPVVINLSIDRSFYFELKTPGVAYFIKKYIESNECSKINGFYHIEKNSFFKFLYEVVLIKLYLYNNNNLTIDEKFIKNYFRSLLGTASSFNIKIINKNKI